MTQKGFRKQLKKVFRRPCKAPKNRYLKFFPRPKKITQKVYNKKDKHHSFRKIHMSYKRRPRRVKVGGSTYRNYNSRGEYTSTTTKSGSRKNGGTTRSINNKTGKITYTWGSGEYTYTSQAGGHKKTRIKSSKVRGTPSGVRRVSYRTKKARPATPAEIVILFVLVGIAMMFGGDGSTSASSSFQRSYVAPITHNVVPVNKLVDSSEVFQSNNAAWIASGGLY